MKLNHLALVLKTALVTGLTSTAIAQPAISLLHPIKEWNYPTTQADCQEQDLSEIFGPARQQNNVGWCYANAAADLLTYYYKSKFKDGERASAAYVALVYNEALKRAPQTWGGIVDGAFADSYRRGMCPDTGELAIVKAGPMQRDFAGKLGELYDFKVLFDEAKTDPSKRADFKKLAKLYVTTGSTFMKIPEKDRASILQNSTPNSFPITFADYMCVGRRVLPKGPEPQLALYDKEYAPDVQFAPFMRRQLLKGNPVSIDYDATFLLTAEYPPARDLKYLHQLAQAADEQAKTLEASKVSIVRSLARTWEKLHARLTGDGPPEMAPQLHASLLVGQHWNANQNRCEWIIRNSWGPGCDRQNPDLTKNCVKGNIYIEQKRFEGYLYRMRWLKSQPEK